MHSRIPMDIASLTYPRYVTRHTAFIVHRPLPTRTYDQLTSPWCQDEGMPAVFCRNQIVPVDVYGALDAHASIPLRRPRVRLPSCPLCSSNPFFHQLVQAVVWLPEARSPMLSGFWCVATCTPRAPARAAPRSMGSNVVGFNHAQHGRRALSRP